MTSETMGFLTDKPESLDPAWGATTAARICPACKTTYLSPTTDRQVCPFCHSAKLEEQIDFQINTKPELALEFGIQPEATRNQLDSWSRAVWLRPSEFNADTLAGRLTRCYLPMWLVDGCAIGTWQAEVGFDYQVISSEEAFSNGQWSSREQTEVKIRWEPRAGSLNRNYQNLAVPALEAHDHLINGLGKYPVREASKFEASLVQNALVRLPDLSPDKAWPMAKTQFDRAATQDCQQAAAGQHVDHYQSNFTYSNLNWTLLLLPVYSTYYKDDQGLVQNILINGRNGQIFGLRRASQSQGWRWTGTLLGIGLACIFVALLLTLGLGVLAPLAILSTVLLIAGFIITLLSPIPAIWAWQFNRSSH
jgi:hypothetical protein